MFDFSVTFDAVDKISGKIARINAKLSKVERKAKGVKRAFGRTFNGKALVATVRLKTKAALGKLRAFTDRVKQARVKIIALAMASGYAISKMMGEYTDVRKAQGTLGSLGISNKGQEAIFKMGDKLSKKFGQIKSSNFVAAAYDIKSGIASLSEIDVGKVTEIASKLSVATLASQQTMTKFMAIGYGTFRQQFKSDIEFASKFAAATAKSVQMFRTTGDDMSQGFSTIGGFAQKMNATMEQQFAILGTSKSVFDTAAKGAEKYKAFLRGVINAEGKLKLGMIDPKTNKMKDTLSILELIKKKYGKLDALEMGQLQKAFGSSEAVEFIVALIDKTKQLKQAEHDIAAAKISDMNKMAQAMQKGWGLERLQNRFASLSVTLGTAFAPTIEKIGDAISKLTDKVQAFVAKDPKGASQFFENIAKLVGLTAGLMAFGAALGVIKTAVNGILAPLKLVWTVAKVAFPVGGWTLTVGITGVAAVLAGLHSIAKASHQAIQDKHSIAPKAGNIDALTQKVDRLKKKIADMKAGWSTLGGAWQKIMGTGNNKFGIAQQEKLLARAQANLAKAKAAAQQQLQTTHVSEVQSKVISAVNVKTDRTVRVLVSAKDGATAQVVGDTTKKQTNAVTLPNHKGQ